MYLIRIQTIYVDVGKFLIYPGNKYNNNLRTTIRNTIRTRSVSGILPSVIAPTMQARLVLKPEAIFLGLDRISIITTITIIFI